MTGALSQIWRYPIKGIGSESLDSAELKANAPLPGDRAWALRHDGAAKHSHWQPRRNFLVVASGPALAAVSAKSKPNGTFSLHHPIQGTLNFDPEIQAGDLLDWIRPLWPEQHSRPDRLINSPPIGMADNGQAQVSIMNLASLRALSQRMGHQLDPRRFRGNLWVDGFAPWEEFDWLGKSVQIRDVTLTVTDRIERCRATEANPDTGLRDADPCRALMDAFGHRDFGVYATVTCDGTIAIADQVVCQQ